MVMFEAATATWSVPRDFTTRLEAGEIARQRQSYDDSLTSLQNRRDLEVVVYTFIWLEGYLMQVNIDRFKYINDTYGLGGGDHTPDNIAEILLKAVRS